MPWKEEKAAVPLQKASTKHTATQVKCNESDKTMKDALLLMLSRTKDVNYSSLREKQRGENTREEYV